ncbi:hypothetical protein TNCV_4649851 [Trichonephila clavipes]|uniref:Uncharacterized protein n=1 Tax=Trichonephila clavipes TaxID=2585209 RepID=A0A8X6SYQ2_TRICX|nr:hypothetical protein TNCV_4649851 [Trichonephila clavipes]
MTPTESSLLCWPEQGVANHLSFGGHRCEVVMGGIIFCRIVDSSPSATKHSSCIGTNAQEISLSHQDGVVFRLGERTVSTAVSHHPLILFENSGCRGDDVLCMGRGLVQMFGFGSTSSGAILVTRLSFRISNKHRSCIHIKAASVKRLANQRLHLARDEVSDWLDAHCLGVNVAL